MKMGGIIRNDQLLIDREAYEDLLALQDKNLELKSLTGMDIDDVVDKFVHGYRFVKMVDYVRDAP